MVGEADSLSSLLSAERSRIGETIILQGDLSTVPWSDPVMRRSYAVRGSSQGAGQPPDCPTYPRTARTTQILARRTSAPGPTLTTVRCIRRG